MQPQGAALITGRSARRVLSALKIDREAGYYLEGVTPMQDMLKRERYAYQSPGAINISLSR